MCKNARKRALHPAIQLLCGIKTLAVIALIEFITYVVRQPSSNADLDMPDALSTERMAVGKMFRLEREAQQLSLDDAAERMDIDPRHLRRIEADGTDLRLSSLVRIAHGLGMRASELLARAEAVIGAPERGAAVSQPGSGDDGLAAASGTTVTAPQRLAANVVVIRRARKLTQALLADRAGLSLFTVQSVERGRHAATIRTMGAIADALGVSPAELHAPGRTPPATPRRIRRPKVETGA